ncbi:MAG: hypothetical protein ACPGSC_11705 [Granulosicoccaceae bacterium]
MFDLYQSHWVKDQQQLYLASAPSAQAPIRFKVACPWHQGNRRLAEREANRIYQASLDAGMLPLTFLHSAAGISFVQEMIAELQ